MTDTSLVEMMANIDGHAQLATRIAQLNQRIAELEAGLRAMGCPVPATGDPDDIRAGDCFDKGHCGCVAGAALRSKEP